MANIVVHRDGRPSQKHPWSWFRRVPRFQPGQSKFRPAFDFEESPGRYQLHAVLPGVKHTSVEVTLAGNFLRVSGTRNAPEPHQRDTAIGPFVRVFKLPENVDLERVRAELEDGVLTVTLPKTA